MEIRGVRCMFMGTEVYECGDISYLGCMSVGTEVYVCGAKVYECGEE